MSRLKRIDYLEQFVAEFDEAAAKRKDFLRNAVKEGDYYIQNGYVMPRVP